MSASRPKSPLTTPPVPPEPVIATLPVSGKITPATATRPAPVTPSRAPSPTTAMPDETITRLIYDLVRERLLNSVGPTGSFAVTVRTGTTDDSLFTQAFAESLARDITATLQQPAAPAHPQPVHPERLSG
ncbi:MAG TPA: hypothetical protein VGP24_00885 [Glaciihabitans sp.]|nr:hypothetical protein [Glaciihabitans sp.]